MEFELVAKDVVVVDGARRFVDAGRLADSIAATAVFTHKRLRVEPHGTGNTTMTVTLPHGVRHRAMVALFQGRTLVISGNRKALMSLGTLFTFEVSGNVSVTAGQLEVTPPSGAANAQLRTVLVNDGTEPVVPTGMGVLIDAEGRLMGKAPFTPRRLLPGESAALIAEYAGDLAQGAYRAVATFDIGGRSLSLTSPLNVP